MANSQQGYFTSAQAKKCGYSYALLSHHASRGNFVRLLQGVYRLSESPPVPREEVVVAWLAAGPDDAVVSHESALEILELSDIVPSSVHITLPRKRRWYRAPAGVTVHTTSLPLDDVVVRQGIRLTGPVRSIVDCAEWGSAPEQVEMAVRQAVDRGITAEGELLRQTRERSERVRRLVQNALDFDKRESQ